MSTFKWILPHVHICSREIPIIVLLETFFCPRCCVTLFRSNVLCINLSPLGTYHRVRGRPQLVLPHIFPLAAIDQLRFCLDQSLASLFCHRSTRIFPCFSIIYLSSNFDQILKLVMSAKVPLPIHVCK